MKRKTIIALETSRTAYSLDDLGRTMTVGELIDFLSQFDKDTEICFSNDGGRTYGAIEEDCIIDMSESSDAEELEEIW